MTNSFLLQRHIQKPFNCVNISYLPLHLFGVCPMRHRTCLKGVTVAHKLQMQCQSTDVNEWLKLLPAFRDISGPKIQIFEKFRDLTAKFQNLYKIIETYLFQKVTHIFKRIGTEIKFFLFESTRKVCSLKNLTKRFYTQKELVFLLVRRIN